MKLKPQLYYSLMIKLWFEIKTRIGHPGTSLFTYLKDILLGLGLETYLKDILLGLGLVTYLKDNHNT